MLSFVILLGMVFFAMPANNARAASETDGIIIGRYITDMYTDKSRYCPGDTVTVIIECRNFGEAAFSGTLEFRLKRFGQLADTYPDMELKLNSGEAAVKTFVFVPPEEDFRGYTLEAYLSDGSKTVDYAMHAVDVSSDWNRYPRMGYLTKYFEQSDEKVEANLDWLSKFYITGLFYYDHMNAHDEPLAGTAENPDENWKNVANVDVDGSTFKHIQEYANSKNMLNFAYNLNNGGFDDYLEKGLKAEWGTYKDKNHQNQDYHPMSVYWKTEKLWLFDPGNPEYQEYYVNNHRALFEAQSWDGMIIDSLSGRPYTIYDYYGNVIPLDERYAGLIQKFRTEIGTRVMFNASDGYGMNQVAEETDYDILFGEIYENHYPTYLSLKDASDNAYSYTKGYRGVSYPAYMHFESEPANYKFNTPSVIFTNSVINATGGNHLELGDRGMLHVVYYPANRMSMKVELEEATRRQYDFSVAYEELLRGPGLEEVFKKTMIDGHFTTRMGSAGAIWTFAKENQMLGAEIIHFLNFETITTTEWKDPKGKQVAPEVIENAVTRYYTDKEVTQVLVGSPDSHEGILQDVPFTLGEDKNGRYVEFTMESLEYWNMVVLL